jgi:L-amino acid N-acyltransferase YncA
MFVTHPGKRNRHTITELFGKLITHLESNKALTLVSNVFKVNELSVEFHRKLGFSVTREAPQGYEFTLALDSAEANKLLQWTRKSSRH